MIKIIILILLIIVAVWYYKASKIAKEKGEYRLKNRWIEIIISNE